MKNKRIYIEVLRIISAIMVFYIHSPLYGCWESAGMSEWIRIIYMIPSIIASCAVPIFMMITGSLLLKKDESISEIIKKRIWRVVKIILFVTALALIRSIVFNTDYTVTSFILDFFNFDGRKSILYWFLYWWLSFVILLPFLQKFVKKISDVDFKYLLVLYLIFNIIFPTINIVLNHFFQFQIKISSSFSLFIISTGIFYPFLGYIIDNNINEKEIKLNKLSLIFVIALGILLSIILNLLSKDANGNISPRNIFTPVISVSVFILIKKVFINSKNEKMNSIICFFGEQAIGVYLLQVIMPDIVIMLKSLFPTHLNMFFARIIVLVFNFILCSFITAILRKLPIIKRIL